MEDVISMVHGVPELLPIIIAMAKQREYEPVFRPVMEGVCLGEDGILEG